MCQCQLSGTLYPESPTVDNGSKGNGWVQLDAGSPPIYMVFDLYFADLAAMEADPTRTLYVLDVRDPVEFRAGTRPGGCEHATRQRQGPGPRGKEAGRRQCRMRPKKM